MHRGLGAGANVALVPELGIPAPFQPLSTEAGRGIWGGNAGACREWGQPGQMPSAPSGLGGEGRLSLKVGPLEPAGGLFLWRHPLPLPPR